MENHLKSFPSYDIAKLRWLLARSYEREKKLMEAIDELEGDGFRRRFCRACLEVTTEQTFWCDKCGQHGCGDCNTETKGIVECEECGASYCEKCDPLVLPELSSKTGGWTCGECSGEYQ